MQRRRWWLLAVVFTLLALVAGACGDDDDPTVESGEGSDTTEAEGPPEFEDGTTMAALQEKGKITVGTKFDQPLFGLKDPVSGDIEGFDVEIAKLVAQRIFGGELDEMADKIEFVETVSANREPFI